MNAVLKSDLTRQTESDDWGDEMAEDSLGELRSDVRHIQSHVTDIKAEVRATNVRLDKFQDKIDSNSAESLKRLDAAGVRQDNERKELGQKIDGARDRIDELGKDTAKEFTTTRTEIGGKFDGVLGKFDGVHNKIDELRKDTSKEFTAVRSELGGKIDDLRKHTDTEFTAVRAELGAIKVWTMRLVFGLALTLVSSLLYVMARGFKWI